MRSRGKGADACLIIRTGTVELHRHDVPRDHAIRVRLAHRNDVRPADADVAEPKASVSRGEGHGIRVAVIQSIQSLVAELNEDQRTICRDRPRSPSILVNATSDVPRHGQNVADRVGHDVSTALVRASFTPPHPVTDPASALNRMPTHGNIASGDR
mgnify:CR=1 FL=1